MIRAIFTNSVGILFLFLSQPVFSQGTRLLRQPSLSDTHIAFVYAGDIWVAQRDGANVQRITSTPALESNPILSPDGESIAFTSNRSGNSAVYVVARTGGSPQRLTWHPSGAIVRGWTRDNAQILYASTRDFAPRPSNRLWLVPKGGGNSTLLAPQRGFNGSFADDEKKIAIEQVSRWDTEWRNYRGGQNKALIILDLQDLSEELIPNESTTDVHPVWIGSSIYFLSDRDGTMNVWAYSTENGNLRQVTNHQGADIKWLSGKKELAFEREGYLFILDPASGQISQLEIEISADFPWAEPQWVKVNDRISSPSLSPNGKRMLVEARGEIFTIPVEHGNSRNLTASSGVADRRPIWSPKGDQIAWFSDDKHQDYVLRLSPQDGMGQTKDIALGESKLAWEPTWSPDGEHIAFVDNDLRVRVLNLASKTIKTVDHGGINIERGNMGLRWSPDSKWLAYSKFGLNNFKRIMVWSEEEDRVRALTNAFADAFSPVWDLDAKHLYFLASTDLALRSGWSNTSSLNARPEYAAYVVNLDQEDPSPFKLRSDEEEPEAEKEKSEEKEEAQKQTEKKKKKKEDQEAGDEKEEEKKVKIDFENLDRRIIALPIPVRNYRSIYAGTEGVIFITESIPNEQGLNVHKFSLSERKSTPYLKGASGIALSQNGEKCSPGPAIPGRSSIPKARQKKAKW
jgi:tricorn protease